MNLPAGHDVLVGRAVAAVLAGSSRGAGANRLASLANVGQISVNLTPGMAVSMTPNSPFTLTGRVGLGVERVVVARAAAGPDEDAVDAASRLPAAARLLRRQSQRQRQAQAGQRPDLQKAAAADAVAIAGQAGGEAKHGGSWRGSSAVQGRQDLVDSLSKNPSTGTDANILIGKSTAFVLASRCWLHTSYSGRRLLAPALG